MEWITKSRLIATLPLGDGRFLMTHILGRVRILGSVEAIDFLSDFELPVKRELAERADSGKTEWIRRLLDARLLRRSGQDEKLIIQNAYRSVRALPAATSGFARVDDGESSGCSHPEQNLRLPAGYEELSVSELMLSKSIATLCLHDGEMLAIHPTGSLTHMTGQLWQIAQEFSAPTAVSRVVATLSSRISEVQCLRAIYFLLRRGFLWRSVEAEQEAGGQYAAQFNDLSDDLKMMLPAKERWRQLFRPYDPAMFGEIQRRARLAFLGPCLVQQFIECLEYHAEREGWDLDVYGALHPDISLDGRNWDLIFTSIIPFATTFYAAISEQDFPGAQREIPAVLAAIDRHIDEIRSYSNSTILIVKPSRGGLTGFSAFSEGRHREIELIGILNARLLALSRHYADVRLLDEDDLALGFPGVYWDDELNGNIHHAPMNAERWVSLANRLHHRWDVGQLSDGHVAPSASSSLDPAVQIATSILDFLVLRESSVDNIQAVLLDPDGILWPGKLQDHTQPVSAPSPFADVEDYVYVGLHDAILKLIRRGVPVYCRFNGSIEFLRSWYQCRTPNGVAVDDFAGLFATQDVDHAISEITSRSGISERNILYLSAAEPAPKNFGGYVFTGPIFSLRRSLLTDSKLRSSLELDQVFCKKSRTDVSVADFSIQRGDVRKTILQAVSRATGRTVQECATAQDFRTIGLDSIGAMSVAHSIEAALKVSLRAEDLTESVIFYLSRLESVTLRRLEQMNQQSERCRSDKAPVEPLSVKERIKTNLAHDARPWAMKIFCADSVSNYRYLTANEVLRQVERVAESLLGYGLGTGERVLLCVSGQQSQVIAALGVIFADLSLLVFSAIKDEADDQKLRRIHEICTQHAIAAVILDATFAKTGITGNAVIPHNLLVIGMSDSLESELVQASHRDDRSVTDGVPRLLLMTSGSTGTRKLIAHSYSVIEYQMKNLGGALKIDSSDIVVSWTPLHHTMGLVLGLVLPLVWGIPLIRIPGELWTRRPELLFSQMSRERGTVAFMPNFAFAVCAQRIQSEHLQDLDLSHVKALVSCGEPVTGNILTDFCSKFAPYGLRQTSVLAGYGMSETAGKIAQATPGRSPRCLKVMKSDIATLKRITPASGTAKDEELVTLVSSGPIVAGTHVVVKDRTVHGEIGELLIFAPCFSSANGMAGDRFVEVDGKLFLRSGDLGFIYENEVFVIGRVDDMIKSAGQLIDPGDIEAHIVAAVGSVASEVVAVGIEDAVRGTQRLVVIVEVESVSRLHDEALIQQVSEVVWKRTGHVTAQVKLVPSSWIVRTLSGKKSRGLSKQKLLVQEESLIAAA